MSRRKTLDVVEIGEDKLKRIARIIGPSSAAACALKDLDRRRSMGENPVVYSSGGSFYVGPRMDENPSAPVKMASP